MLLDALQIRVPKETCASGRAAGANPGLQRPSAALVSHCKFSLCFKMKIFRVLGLGLFVFFFFLREIPQCERDSSSEGQDRAALVLACRAQEIQRHRQRCRTCSDINGALSSQANHSHASQNSCQTAPKSCFQKLPLERKKKKTNTTTQLQGSVAQ